MSNKNISNNNNNTDANRLNGTTLPSSIRLDLLPHRPSAPRGRHTMLGRRKFLSSTRERRIPRPSDVDYYSSSHRTGGSKDTQPDWDKNESWGSYKSPGQRRRELGYEFKGTDALKNYVDPRDQYERRVSNHSPEAEYIYNQHNIRSNDELRAPRHDINNYTNTIPERDRLIPKPMERPKPGYIPTEVLIAMGGASLSSHIKTKVEDGSIREMRRQKKKSLTRKKESNATNMFGEKVNTNNMFRRGS